jgi:hypothetical protein
MSKKNKGKRNRTPRSGETFFQFRDNLIYQIPTRLFKWGIQVGALVRSARKIIVVRDNIEIERPLAELSDGWTAFFDEREHAWHIAELVPVESLIGTAPIVAPAANVGSEFLSHIRKVIYMEPFNGWVKLIASFTDFDTDHPTIWTLNPVLCEQPVVPT